MDVDLDAATDRGIWEYAAEHELVVVSKDSDFRQLAFLYGPPPKVVWLRVGRHPQTRAVIPPPGRLPLCREIVDPIRQRPVPRD